MLPGNWSQGLSQSCINAISIAMPPSVCTNKAETALRMKGRKKLLGSTILDLGTVIKAGSLLFSTTLWMNPVAKSFFWPALDLFMHKWESLPCRVCYLCPMERFSGSVPSKFILPGDVPTCHPLESTLSIPEPWSVINVYSKIKLILNALGVGEMA